MSDTTRDDLAQLIDHLIGDGDTAVREFLARETADAILERYLVVPRSDIVIEYGVEFRGMNFGNHRSADVARFRARTMYSLGEDAARERETWAGPWLPSPLPECGAVATDGVHARQADVVTPPGIVACAVCPATTQWPLPEGGQS